MLREALPQLSDVEAQQLMTLYELLVEWNQRVNLTSIIELGDVVVKHFADSLSARELFGGEERLLDIGCGAGFPCLPLKIVLPSIKVTATDSINKKITFIRHVIHALGLSDIQAVHTRIEDHTVFDYDVVTARALCALPTLVEYALPFLKLGGRLIAYKSADCQAEIDSARNALMTLGGQILEVKTVRLPLGDIVRKLIVVQKVAPTPKGYPRPKNLPRLKPL